MTPQSESSREGPPGEDSREATPRKRKGRSATDLIALYAAIVATAALAYQVISQINAAARHLQVTLTAEAGGNLCPSDTMVGIQVTNDGHPAVSIEAVGFSTMPRVIRSPRQRCGATPVLDDSAKT